MAIKIKEIYGYTLLYDERSKRFVVWDTDGTELANATTQDEAEVKAKTLHKQEFSRIPVMRVVSDGRISRGELTSLNRDEKSAWVSMEKSERTWGSGRQKISLRYDSGYYEATETNLKTVEDIKAKREIIDGILAEIEGLRDTLDKPINLSYFGITG